MDRRRAALSLWGAACLCLAVSGALIYVVGTVGNPGYVMAADGGANEGTAWDWKDLGQLIFANNCAACHGMDGAGMPGVFPALRGNDFVAGEPMAVIRVPMNGRGGMPSFRNALSDTELAAVLSYVRNSWGNEADPIAPDMVGQVRAE